MSSVHRTTKKKPKKEFRGGRLPKQIIPLPNKDKDSWHESWYPKRNPLNIPHPFRAVALGPPNSGKTTVVKNILIRAYPQFKRVYLIHCDGENSREYEDVNGIEIMNEIPQPEEWDGEDKSLVILDDIEFGAQNKLQKRALDRLFGYVSTHKNISVICCNQDPFCVPSIVRRCCNLFILWKQIDLDSLATCARKTGLRSDAFKALFDQLFTNPKDSLWLDLTDKSSYPMRLNGFKPIKRIEGDESKKENAKQDKYESDPDSAS